MIQEIQHVIERAKLIKDFVDLPRGSAVHHRIDEIVELLQGLQRREEADHKIMDALSPIQRELSALLSAGKETA
jgi:hypothetical protein